MNIIDHGKWMQYVPDKPPDDAPPNAMFCKRDGDGIDWYDYSRDPKTFDVSTVKFMAVWRSYANGYVVGPAVYDATMLWPPNHIVGEITDYPGGNPQTDFGNKVYDPVAKTFKDMPPPQPGPVELRLAALEKKLDQLGRKT